MIHPGTLVSCLGKAMALLLDHFNGVGPEFPKELGVCTDIKLAIPTFNTDEETICGGSAKTITAKMRAVKTRKPIQCEHSAKGGKCTEQDGQLEGHRDACRDTEEGLAADQPSKSVVTSDLFKMIEKATSDVKTQAKKYKQED